MAKRMASMTAKGTAMRRKKPMSVRARMRAGRRQKPMAKKASTAEQPKPARRKCQRFGMSSMKGVVTLNRTARQPKVMQTARNGRLGAQSELKCFVVTGKRESRLTPSSATAKPFAGALLGVIRLGTDAVKECWKERRMD